MTREDILRALEAKAIEGWMPDVGLLTPEMAASALEALLQERDRGSSQGAQRGQGAPTPCSPEDQSLTGLSDMIAEAVENGGGIWRTCSGCCELEDGQNVHGYPHSKTFGCTLGGGCGECGGLGAVWDTTDYNAMADWIANDLKGDKSAATEAERVEQRLAIARVIDPIAVDWTAPWRQRAGFFDLTSGPHRMRDIERDEDDECQEMYRRRVSAFQRADAIVALTPLSSPSGEGWRPIETAPKDGTRALFYGIGAHGKPYMDVTAWPANWTGLWPIAYMAYADGNEPTHWQPLPPPPANPDPSSRAEGAAGKTGQEL